MLRRTWQRASLTAVLTVGSLAGTATVTDVATPALASASVSAPASATRTYDEALVDVAQAVPGFAGAWVEDGALAVAVTRDATASAATKARGELARTLVRPDIATMQIAIRPARFAFDDLKTWHDAVSREALAVEGVLSSDVDERANVVRIGTSDPTTTHARIRAIATAHGVPPAALVVERAAPVVEQGLRDHNVPAVGGVEISWVEPKGVHVYQCTLGFPAVRGGVLGYVTNSHCTSQRGALDNTVHQQPAGGVPIGHEIADPPHVANASCPAGRICRYSDSSFYSLHADALYDHGHLARPAPGSVVWNGTDRFRITAEAAPVVGEAVTKVGRTTGRTSGSVRATCKNYNVISFNLTMLCQTEADYFSSSGDSGSPVFAITSGDDVALGGINWGRLDTRAVFSPIDGIQRDTELGPLTTCAAGFTC